MSKNIVYMVNIVHDERSKNQKYEWGVKSWGKWCEKNNSELVILDEPLFEIEYMAPQWYKTFIFDLLDNSNMEYNKILYVDSDTIVHPDMPNIFETHTEGNFCAIRNIGSVDWVLRSLENYSKYVFNDFKFPYYEYFNSGVMLFDKTHKPMFKKMQEFYQTNRQLLVEIQTKLGVGKDQPVFNFFAQKETNLKILPYEYNMQDMVRFEVIGPDMLHTKYGWIYHFNCGVKPTPGYWMEQTYKYLYE